MFVVCCCPDECYGFKYEFIVDEKKYLFLLHLLFWKHIFLWNKNFFCIGEYETIDTIKLRMSRLLIKVNMCLKSLYKLFKFLDFN